MTKALQPPAWQKNAVCAQVDTEIFFPEKGSSSARFAKQVCRGCTVRLECLQFAIDQRERYGVYGGMSERGRRQLEKRMAAEGRTLVTQADLDEVDHKASEPAAAA